MIWTGCRASWLAQAQTGQNGLAGVDQFRAEIPQALAGLLLRRAARRVFVVQLGTELPIGLAAFGDELAVDVVAFA